MPKRSSRLDLSQLAKRIVDEATGEAEKTLPPQKNQAAVALGRLGGLKGGKARAEKLSSQRRIDIAKMAASARWNNVIPIGGRMALKWRKRLSKSDAQQETLGTKMPFRFTKGSLKSGSYQTWFRNTFFADATWTPDFSRSGNPTEVTKIKFHVTIAGNDLGKRTMKIDYYPERIDNHNAPTTHLIFDSVTKQTLESANLTGHYIVFERDDSGEYHLTVD